MTRRKLVMGQRSQEEGNNSTMWELPTHWTAAQALAVFEEKVFADTKPTHKNPCKQSGTRLGCCVTRRSTRVMNFCGVLQTGHSRCCSSFGIFRLIDFGSSRTTS